MINLNVYMNPDEKYKLIFISAKL